MRFGSSAPVDGLAPPKKALVAWVGSGDPILQMVQIATKVPLSHLRGRRCTRDLPTRKASVSKVFGQALSSGILRAICPILHNGRYVYHSFKPGAATWVKIQG